jgi:hypothetical protein
MCGELKEFFYCKNCRYPFSSLFSGRLEEECFVPIDKTTFELWLPCEGGSSCDKVIILTCKIIKVSREDANTRIREDVTNKPDEELKKEGDKFQEEWFAQRRNINE